MTGELSGRPWTEQVEGWRCNHFTISERTANVSRLLRKVADALDELGAIDVLDVTFCTEVDAPQIHAKMSVYFVSKDQ